MSLGDDEGDAGGGEVVEGGEPPCMLNLVCEECGRLNDDPELVNCGGCGRALGRE